MKKTALIISFKFITLFFLFSCGKNKCAECHYDYGSTQIELGEKCGDDLKSLEANGFLVNDTLYEVHCHQH
jgi:hypothetical protein